MKTTASHIKAYFPLFLIFAYITGFSVLSQARVGSFQWMPLMNSFMSGFFLVFSFFKLLKLEAFSDAYQGYDIVAKHCPFYGYLYPFIELGLGISYFMGIFPVATNLICFAVMSVSSVGVVMSLFGKKRLQCACLGTVVELPMSQVTLVEDILMVAMSAVMLKTLL